MYLLHIQNVQHCIQATVLNRNIGLCAHCWFGVVSNTDWIRYDTDDDLIDYAMWMQPEELVYALTEHTAHVQDVQIVHLLTMGEAPDAEDRFREAPGVALGQQHHDAHARIELREQGLQTPMSP